MKYNRTHFTAKSAKVFAKGTKKKNLAFLACIFLAFFAVNGCYAQNEIGIDIGQPINPSTGAINQGTDTAIVGATCTPWVRVNFILGPWSSPTDNTLHNGKTFQQTYDEIINGFVSKGIQVYALIGAEAYSYPGGTLEQYPGSDSAASVAWIQGYTANFVSIVNMFKDRVRVFESYNEPNNWTNSSTAIVHSAWFALLLQEIYLNTKYFNSHNIDPAWQVTLVSGALFTFDLNTGGQYINDTYWYGKNIFAWDWTHQNAGSYPLDGFGQHIYVAQGDSVISTVTAAINTNLNDFWNNIYVYETDPAKQIWISEFGWETTQYGESFQATNLTTGFNVLQADARVKLSLWFTLSDFPGGDWGIYYMGNYLPTDQKFSYSAFKNRNSCPTNTTEIKNNSVSQNICLARDNEIYFLLCNAEKETRLDFSIYSIAGQELRKQKFNLQEGKNKIVVDVLGLSAGLYLLNTKTGGINKTFKLMVY
jgi:hypothetical protein